MRNKVSIETEFAFMNRKVELMKEFVGDRMFYWGLFFVFSLGLSCVMWYKLGSSHRQFLEVCSASCIGKPFSARADVGECECGGRR